jgi:hypothetical protein
MKWQQEGQCTYERNIAALSCNNSCRGNAKSITYSECVSVAIIIQRTKHMCLIILTSVSCLDLQNFSTLSYKGHDFRKVCEREICVVIFCTMFV